VLVCLPLVLVPVLAGCGGDGDKAATATTSAGPDPGKETMDALLGAASRKDAAALWALLSASSRKRLGPTQSAFAAKSASTIEEALEPFVGSGAKPFISHRISERFGVVAIRRGADVFAVPLRNQQGKWRVEWPGPVKIDIGGPQPGSSTVVGQVGVEIHAPGPPTAGLIWVDGQPVEPRIYTGPRSATVFSNLAKPLVPGVHSAVAYAEWAADASALAWTFTATRATS
jgi:hypothetical protein